MPEQDKPLATSAVLRHPTLHRRIYYLGVFGLFFFGFSAFLHVAWANQGLLLMLLVALARWRIDVQLLAHDRMLHLSLAFLGYLVVRTLWANAAFPEGSAEAWDAAQRWPITGFIGVVLIGYWLSRVRAGPEWLLAALLTGFLARILSRLDWAGLGDQLAAFARGTERATFGYSSVNLGIWAAIALLGLIVFWRRIVGGEARRPERLARLLLWLGVAGIATAALVFSQTRSAWLVTLLVLPPVVLATLHTGLGSRRRFAAAALILLALGLLGVYRFAQTDLVQQRLAISVEAIEQAASGEATDTAAVGVGVRVAMYRLFWDRWREHPVFGWGPGSMPRALEEGGIEAPYGKRFEHFHNSFFSLLYQFGLVGGAFVVAMFVLIFREILLSHREGAMPPDVATFLLAGLLVMLLSALVNEPMQSSNGGFLLSALGGIAYSYRYRRRLAPVSAGGIPG